MERRVRARKQTLMYEVGLAGLVEFWKAPQKVPVHGLGLFETIQVRLPPLCWCTHALTIAQFLQTSASCAARGPAGGASWAPSWTPAAPRRRRWRRRSRCRPPPPRTAAPPLPATWRTCCRAPSDTWGSCAPHPGGPRCSPSPASHCAHLQVCGSGIALKPGAAEAARKPQLVRDSHDAAAAAPPALGTAGQAAAAAKAVPTRALSPRHLPRRIRTRHHRS